VKITSSKRPAYIILAALWLILLHLTASQPIAVKAQTPQNQPDPAVAAAIFEAMTPAERVGQLFMVSFNGSNTAPNSNIAELIQRYRVGGVYISAENRNFVNNSTTPAQVLTLTNALQRLAQTAPPITTTLEITTTPTTPAPTPTLTSTVEGYTPIPLFIAANHEGDGFPYTQIRGSLTEVPNAMALGATWNPDNARMIGQVVGQELPLLGVNLLLGPVLDVLDNPRPEQGGLLGTRTFGGHPFWVGQMGQAYIRGVHQGSNGQLLTIAKHFPGFGSSDRAINQGVPAILKSLDDLQQKELAPFFQVTRVNPDDSAGMTDGLMTAHVRYQGLQGNLPISLDARNLATILALKEFAPWRQAGGLVMSAPLGVPAALEGIAGVSKENFPARLLVQNAFLAGSDILFLQDFAFAGEPPEAEIANIKSAIRFFQEKYASEANFRAAVDKAVQRIIAAKLKIYGHNMLETTAQRPQDNLELLKTTPIDLIRLAHEGATRIAPVGSGRVAALPGPPQPDDQILIFTDDSLGQDCPTCPKLPFIRNTALQNILLQLYGPNATGQLSPEQINSLGFLDLENILSDQPAPGKEETEALLEAADWVIFNMLDVNTDDYPQSDAVKNMLRSRYDALRNKNLIVFAFNAPYFLDETEISQLNAYYGLYSKGQVYLQAAAELLFQQFEPMGASPVDIPAVAPLDLNPDPGQVIQLEPMHKISRNGNITPLNNQAEPVTAIDLQVGEGLLFRTSVIVDKYGHAVPDGTSVNFLRYYPLEGLSLEPIEVQTSSGIAQVNIIKERDTPLQVGASSNLAVQSVPFNIGPGIVDTPTPTPTFTPFPTDTPTPTLVATQTPTLILPTPQTPQPTATLPPLKTSPSPAKPVSLIDLVFSILGITVIAGIAFVLGGDRLSLEERVRSALVAIAAGLVGYVSYTILTLIAPASGLWGTMIQPGANSYWVTLLVSVLFAIVGTGIWYLKPGRAFGNRQKRDTLSLKPDEDKLST
jgi:beta-N-acetylhexosaminidase